MQIHLIRFPGQGKRSNVTYSHVCRPLPGRDWIWQVRNSLTFILFLEISPTRELFRLSCPLIFSNENRFFFLKKENHFNSWDKRIEGRGGISVSEGPWEKRRPLWLHSQGSGPHGTSQRPGLWRRRGIGRGKGSGGRDIKLLQNFIE